MLPGPKNQITDIAGLYVGNAQDEGPEIRLHCNDI